MVEYEIMTPLLRSESVHAEIDNLLLDGRASTAYEAEEMFLDSHLDDIVRLIAELDDKSFEQNEAIKLLMSHGSRQREDALR